MPNITTLTDTISTLFALALGATSLQVGTLSSASSLMAMLAPIPGAQWAARWGKHKAVVLISFGLRRLALLGALLAPFFLTGEALIIVVIVLFALRAGLANLGNPAWTALAADTVPVERRGRYFSSRKMVIAIASMLFVPLAGKIKEHGCKSFLDALTSNRVFLLFCLTTVVWNFSLQFGGPYFSVYQVEVLQSTPRVIGLLSTASALVRVVGQPFWGPLIDRRGSRRTSPDRYSAVRSWRPSAFIGTSPSPASEGW